MNQSGWNCVADLRGYNTTISREFVSSRKCLQESCFPGRYRAILLGMGEPPAGHVGAAGRQRRCKVVPFHSPVHIRMAGVILVAIQHEIIWQIGTAATVSGNGPKALHRNGAVGARGMKRVGGIGLSGRQRGKTIYCVADRSSRVRWSGGRWYAGCFPSPCGRKQAPYATLWHSVIGGVDARGLTEDVIGTAHTTKFS